MRWFWMLGLTLAALEDLRHREFPCWILLVWLVPGIVNLFTTDAVGHLYAAVIGLAVLVLAWATRGAIGVGDGLFFLMSACYLNFGETAVLFLAGLGISCIWGMVLLLRLHWSGRAMDTIPFLACAWLPGIWLAWG